MIPRESIASPAAGPQPDRVLTNIRFPDEEIFKISRFKDEMEDLKRFYYTRILANISISDEKSLEPLKRHKGTHVKKYK